MNLGANAAHAMGAEPGVLDISLRNRTIDHKHKDRYRVSSEGKYVETESQRYGLRHEPRGYVPDLQSVFYHKGGR